MPDPTRKNLAYYVGVLEAAAGGRIDPRNHPEELVNDAGEYLINMQEWNWLSRPPLDLDFVADQEYIALPEDFGDVVKLEVPNSLQTTVALTTVADVAYLRGSALHDPFRYHCAIAYPTQEEVDENPGNPHLQIWPTPQTNETGALRLIYRAGWVHLEEMDQVPNIPRDLESILSELIRAQGLSLTDRRFNLFQEWDKISQSVSVQNVARRHGSVQGSLGLSQGGIVQGTGQDFIYRPHRTISRQP